MRRLEPLLRWLPFMVMMIVAVIDLLAGPTLGYLPLLALGPAFASLCCDVRGALLVGLIAVGLCVVLASYDGVLGHRANNMLLISLGGVTLASALASAVRQQRERELADVRTVAEVAQKVLLRPVPRSAGPLRVAVSYISAAAEARIGGDLYEVVTSPLGVRILVGDVQGKGLEAVETAAAVVGAFREAAYDEPDLTGVITRLQTSLDRVLSGERFVTAVIAELRDTRISLMSCGHPPPLAIGVDGGVHFVELPEPAPPLGMTDLVDVQPQVCDVAFAPGDQMLFYTDGVVEARDREGRFYPLQDRAFLLKEQSAEQALEDLRTDLVRHVGGPVADDAAMLLIRHR
ncbi:PP2C family protein-serine/threonine phosphatase [Actinoallomurus acaciae]|uniref:PP2C family protein-serine/threonine phosphatase n=1 Tax=Actinoallomurus acaciae TaxID=502577 RepID=A0ABV5YE94_9ACTN